MINIYCSDGSMKSVSIPARGSEISSIALGKQSHEALLLKINDKLYDLDTTIDFECNVQVLTSKDPEVLEVIRHDAAHLMAEAVKELYPEVQVTIGPAIENGFYYDFASPKAFTEDDLASIEKRMHEISKRNEAVKKEVWKREDAIKFFKDMKEFYKAEIIESIPQGESITLYRQGNFIDLCRGPHLPSTGKVKYFKLMKVAGAYWRGDSKNPMLQRIYGTAWASKEQLENYLNLLEEAEKRDHRKLGRELGLFHFQEEAAGMPFWHQKGYSLFKMVENYIREKIQKAGYVEVKTPLVLTKTLWEHSGHWEKFKENMFIFSSEEQTWGLKPMSCPCHVQIFNYGLKSYRDLPLRMSEFGLCHRKEPSGSLHGLLRVTSMTQDDGHIFCTEEQVEDEVQQFCLLLREVYKDFGFNDITIKFSDRPEKRAGADETWDKAEQTLATAIRKAGFNYILNKGEGAFYGPKLEFILKDAIGREWQCGTLQLDFVLPERLNAYYIDKNGEKRRPAMLHRAILGTLERFLGILIEEYAGKFPLWLAPTQLILLTVTNDSDNYAEKLLDIFKENNIRVEADLSAEKIGYKIRNAILGKVPLIGVIGKKEIETESITIRTLGDQKQITLPASEVINFIKKHQYNKTIQLSL